MRARSLSQDKRRGWVARNTTHSTVHSCPVSSFSGRPCTLGPPFAASSTSAIRLFPILFLVARTYLQRLFPLCSFFLLSSLPNPPPPYCLSLLLLLLLSPLASPSSTPRHLLSYYFVGARGRQVYLSFYMALLFPLLAAIPAYKHRGFI